MFTHLALLYTKSSLVPESYRNLITHCMSTNPSDRLAFSEIVEQLKNDEGFITEQVELNDFLDYIDYIDKYPTQFDPKKRMIKIDEFIKRKTLHIPSELELMN